MIGTAAIDIGAAGTVTFTPTDAPVGQPSRNPPLTLLICQTNAAGACINPLSPASSSAVTVTNGNTVLFTVLAVGKGVQIPYDPANNRVFILANQGTSVVGQASAAVKMQ